MGREREKEQSHNAQSGSWILNRSTSARVRLEPLTDAHSFSIGSGYVEKVGRGVTTAKPGDPVILSYMSCGKCYTCNDGHPAYCVDLMTLNFVGEQVYTSDSSPKHSIGGQFFGQSSFASRTVVKERSVVNLNGIVDNEEDLRMLCPLGCGVQTGSGTMINIGEAKNGDDVAVLGVGGVGLSAVMVRGAKIITRLRRDIQATKY